MIKKLTTISKIILAKKKIHKITKGWYQYPKNTVQLITEVLSYTKKVPKSLNFVYNIKISTHFFSWKECLQLNINLDYVLIAQWTVQKKDMRLRNYRHLSTLMKRKMTLKFF